MFVLFHEASCGDGIVAVSGLKGGYGGIWQMESCWDDVTQLPSQSKSDIPAR